MVNEVQGIGIPTSHTSVQTTPTKEISRTNTINTIDEFKTTIDPDQYKPKLELLSERLNEENETHWHGYLILVITIQSKG